MKSGFKQLLFFFLIVSVMSCANIFAGGAKKTSDAAKFMTAKIQINSRDWDAAIATIGSMTSRYQARRDVKFLLASAQAGKCGLDFLALAQKLSQQGGSSNLFEMLLTMFKGGTNSDVRLTACMDAFDAITSISTDPADRTADENTLAAFIGLAKATAALAITMDTDGDGIADGTDPCLSATVGIGDPEADEIVTGMTNAYFALQQVGGSIGNAFVTAFAAMCLQFTNAPHLGAYDFCTVTEAPITQGNRQGARGMVKEKNNGFGLKIGNGTADQEAAGGGGCGT